MGAFPGRYLGATAGRCGGDLTMGYSDELSDTPLGANDWERGADLWGRSLLSAMNDGISLDGVTLRVAPRSDSALQRRRDLLADEVERHHQEADKHRIKASRAEARLALLQEIPEQDPFQDGEVLVVTWRGKYTYAAIRAAGRWYTTGKGPQAADWLTFVEWLINGDVTHVQMVTSYSRVELTRLS